MANPLINSGDAVLVVYKRCSPWPATTSGRWGSGKGGSEK